MSPSWQPTTPNAPPNHQIFQFFPQSTKNTWFGGALGVVAGDTRGGGVKLFQGHLYKTIELIQYQKSELNPNCTNCTYSKQLLCSSFWSVKLDKAKYSVFVFVGRRIYVKWEYFTITTIYLLMGVRHWSMYYETRTPFQDYTHLTWFGANSKFWLEIEGYFPSDLLFPPNQA